MSIPVVKCVEITKTYNDIVAVNRVSFMLYPGEILSVLGPSGCGKTTLLRMLAGFENLDHGKLFIQNELVGSNTKHLPPERRQLGMVFQEYSLFPHLTVRQNIGFGLNKLSDSDRTGRIMEILDLVRLTGAENRYPHELSGGQQQRVALARTLAPKPLTVLLDEPFSNVDASMRKEMSLEIEQILRENQITTVLVTHDREEAFSIADRIAVMSKGEIEQIDRPEELYKEPSTRFVASMIGISNFLEGKVGDNGQVLTELGKLRFQTQYDEIKVGSTVDLLVHPDDFRAIADPNGKFTITNREFRSEDILLTIELPSGKTISCSQRHDSTLAAQTKITLICVKTNPFIAFHGNSVNTNL